MTEEDISIQEAANIFKQGAKVFRAFEKGSQAAEVLIGLEQNIRDTERAIASTKETHKIELDLLLATQQKIKDAEAEAKKILEDALADAEKKAAKIISDAEADRDQIEKSVSQSTELLADLDAKIPDRQATIADLDKRIAAANSTLEEIRAKAKGI